MNLLFRRIKQFNESSLFIDFISVTEIGEQKITRKEHYRLCFYGKAFKKNLNYFELSQEAV
jgi:hypothetical protein